MTSRDLPVGLHVGPGAPGEAYFLSARYRAELGRPLALEESLLRHPKMRLYVMHAGWPLIDEMLARRSRLPELWSSLALQFARALTMPQLPFRRD